MASQKMISLLLRLQVDNLFREIETKCRDYSREYWNGRRTSGKMDLPSDYFSTLVTAVQHAEKHELDELASRYIGQLYNLLIPESTVRRSTLLLVK